MYGPSPPECDICAGCSMSGGVCPDSSPPLWCATIIPPQVCSSVPWSYYYFSNHLHSLPSFWGWNQSPNGLKNLISGFGVKKRLDYIPTISNAIFLISQTVINPQRWEENESLRGWTAPQTCTWCTHCCLAYSYTCNVCLSRIQTGCTNTSTVRFAYNYKLKFHPASLWTHFKAMQCSHFLVISLQLSYISL